MRWEGFRLNVNTHSGMVNTDSGNDPKSVHVHPEWVFTFVRIRCSRSAGMAVHDGPEYAHMAIFLWPFSSLSAFTVSLDIIVYL